MALTISLMIATSPAAEHSGCNSFDGTYHDSGVVVSPGGAFKKGDPVSFSLEVFRQALPGLKSAKKMRLTVRNNEAVLEAIVIGENESEVALAFPVICARGSYTIGRTYGRSSAGEGVERIGGQEVIELFPETCSIMVRVASAEDYRVWPGFLKKERLKVAYRFSREATCP